MDCQHHVFLIERRRADLVLILLTKWMIINIQIFVTVLLTDLYEEV